MSLYFFSLYCSPELAICMYSITSCARLSTRSNSCISMTSIIHTISLQLHPTHLEDNMASVSFHVVGRLVKVSHSRNVILACLAQHMSIVADHHSSVPEGVPVDAVSLKDGWHNYHIVLLCQLDRKTIGTHLRWWEKLRNKLRWMNGTKNKQMVEWKFETQNKLLQGKM